MDPPKTTPPLKTTAHAGKKRSRDYQSEFKITVTGGQERSTFCIGRGSTLEAVLFGALFWVFAPVHNDEIFDLPGMNPPTSWPEARQHAVAFIKRVISYMGCDEDIKDWARNALSGGHMKLTDEQKISLEDAKDDCGQILDWYSQLKCAPDCLLAFVNGDGPFSYDALRDTTYGLLGDYNSPLSDLYHGVIEGLAHNSDPNDGTQDKIQAVFQNLGNGGVGGIATTITARLGPLSNDSNPRRFIWVKGGVMTYQTVNDAAVQYLCMGPNEIKSPVGMENPNIYDAALDLITRIAMAKGEEQSHTHTRPKDICYHFADKFGVQLLIKSALEGTHMFSRDDGDDHFDKLLEDNSERWWQIQKKLLTVLSVEYDSQKSLIKALAKAMGVVVCK